MAGACGGIGHKIVVYIMFDAALDKAVLQIDPCAIRIVIVAGIRGIRDAGKGVVEVYGSSTVINILFIMPGIDRDPGIITAIIE